MNPDITEQTTIDMKDVKFRAWDGREMFYDVQNAYKGHTGKHHPLESAHAVSFGEALKLDLFEVMQFTGLKDISGKDVFEGDCLKTPRSQIVKVVRYQVDRASFLMANVSDFQFEQNWDIWQKITQKYLWEFEFQVIGNIHENPELLHSKRGGGN